MLGRETLRDRDVHRRFFFLFALPYCFFEVACVQFICLAKQGADFFHPTAMGEKAMFFVFEI